MEQELFLYIVKISGGNNGQEVYVIASTPEAAGSAGLEKAKAVDKHYQHLHKDMFIASITVIASTHLRPGYNYLTFAGSEDSSGYRFQ